MEDVYQIPWDSWYEKGIRGAIFDIDNTLVGHNLPADERIIALMDRLRRIGIKVCLMSNNKEPRVAAFAREVQLPYIYKAGKPAVKNYFKAMEIIGTNRDNTLFAGDQLFTDVYGANRSGIYSILVKPIHPREEIQIVIKRRLEAIVLHFYQKKCKRENKT